VKTFSVNHAAEHWSEDASEDIAQEISRHCDIAGQDLPSIHRGICRTLSWIGSATDVKVGVIDHIPNLDARQTAVRILICGAVTVLPSLRLISRSDGWPTGRSNL
jgi:hypothetical protein